jgi:hypothetical protein
VNELLVQFQSFDTPPLAERAAGRLVDWLNGWLPAERQLRKPSLRYNNILVIAATNRAEALARRCCGPAASTAGSTSTCPTRPRGVSW